jgi:hypothetical protein
MRRRNTGTGNGSLESEKAILNIAYQIVQGLNQLKANSKEIFKGHSGRTQ